VGNRKVKGGKEKPEEHEGRAYKKQERKRENGAKSSKSQGRTREKGRTLYKENQSEGKKVNSWKEEEGKVLREKRQRCQGNSEGETIVKYVRKTWGAPEQKREKVSVAKRGEK